MAETKFLGLIVSKDGIKMDPKKIAVIVDWEEPTNLIEVQSFVGFCNFYRRFVKGFFKIVKPLTALLKKELKNQFVWNEDCQKAFDDMKERISSAPILMHFDHSKEAIVEVDSSDYVNGGCLSQYGDDGILHPVAFFSEKLDPAQCNYEIYDKELLAIVRAFEEWRPELEGTELPIQVLTDHKALEYFMTTKKLTRRQACWALDLANYNFQVTYRPGLKNTKADSLTRKAGDRPSDDNDERQKFQNQTIFTPERIYPDLKKELEQIADSPEPDSEEQVELAAILEDEDPDDEEVEDFLEDQVRIAQVIDPTYERVKNRLQNGDRVDEEFTLADCKIDDNGGLFVQDKLWVPKSIRTKVVMAVHDSPIAGHPGVAKTLFHLKKSYYWRNMHRDLAQFVRNCHVCKRTKPSKEKYQGSL